MKGRGTSVLSATDLQSVSGIEAVAKTHFVIVDAVGVCESDKSDSRPLERQRGTPFPALLLGVALGKRDALTTLAGRLAHLDREVPRPDAAQLRELAGGKTLAELSQSLHDARDPDVISEVAQAFRPVSASAPSDALLPNPPPRNSPPPKPKSSLAANIALN